MRVLVCVAIIPSLVVADRFFFGGCGFNFGDTIDQIAHTEEGYQNFQAFAADGVGKVYLWQPNDVEEDFTNMQLTMLWSAGKFSLSYMNGLVPIIITGDITYQYQPKMAIMLSAVPFDDMNGIFSFDNDGDADLYPVYISETDIVLRGCTGAFLGRVESLYVLTNQDYSSLDSSCAAQTIYDNFDDWEVTEHIHL